MLHVIVGKNAVGKTVMLRKAASKVNRLNIASNLSKYQSPIGMTLEYNTDTINFISEELGNPIISQNEAQLFIEGNSYGKDFLDIMTILSRNVTNFYLDEPEYGLQEHEINMMTHILVKLAYMLPNIWITTHTDLLLDIHSKVVSYYIVEKDNAEAYFLRSVGLEHVYEYADTF